MNVSASQRRISRYWTHKSFNYAQYGVYRNTMTRYSRDHFGSKDMDQYIIHLLRQKQDDKCVLCNESLVNYQINHKRYGEDITVDDLELLHGECHAKITGVKGVNGRQRRL